MLAIVAPLSLKEQSEKRPASALKPSRRLRRAAASKVRSSRYIASGEFVSARASTVPLGPQQQTPAARNLRQGFHFTMRRRVHPSRTFCKSRPKKRRGRRGQTFLSAKLGRQESLPHAVLKSSLQILKSASWRDFGESSASIPAIAMTASMTVAGSGTAALSSAAPVTTVMPNRERQKLKSWLLDRAHQIPRPRGAKAWKATLQLTPSVDAVSLNDVLLRVPRLFSTNISMS